MLRTMWTIVSSSAGRFFGELDCAPAVEQFAAKCPGFPQRRHTIAERALCLPLGPFPDFEPFPLEELFDLPGLLDLPLPEPWAIRGA